MLTSGEGPGLSRGVRSFERRLYGVGERFHGETVLRKTLHVIVRRVTVGRMKKPEPKLHSVRLDDDVWAAIKGMDCSLNVYLRGALLSEEVGEVSVYGRDEIPPRANYREDVENPVAVGQRMASEVSRFDPREIEGVSVGPPLNAYCVHCSSKFVGPKGANICVKCGTAGHSTSGTCRKCMENAHKDAMRAKSTAVDADCIDYEEGTGAL